MNLCANIALEVGHFASFINEIDAFFEKKESSAERFD